MSKIVKETDRPPFSKVVLAALLLGLLTIAFVLMSSAGFRMEWWGYGSSLKILRAAVVIAVGSILLSAIGVYLTWPGRKTRGLAVSIISLIAVGTALATPLYWNYLKSQLPPIQDISTDLETPPEFWDAPTSRIYPGGEVASQQLAAYPDIRPITLAVPLDQVFERAVRLVEDKGWKLVAANPEEGRIEATVTTFWYGFKDDVAIRLTEVERGVKVDMRSASRFGSSGDGGSNAYRIRDFLAALE